MEDTTPDTQRSISTFLGILLVIVILFVLKAAKTVALPLAISCFCFLLCNPIVDRMERLRFPRWLSTLIVMVALLVFFLACGWFFFITINTLVRQVPSYIPRVAMIDNWLTEFLVDKFDADLGGATLLSLINFNWAKILMDSLYSVSGKFVSIASDAMLIYIFVFFLLLERQSLIPKLKVMSNHKGMKVAVLFERVNRQVSKYLLLKALISAATGVLFFLAALVTGLDFAFLWGVLAFVLNFIPSIGSIIITVMTILMAIIQFAPDWAMIIYVAVLMISIQMVLGNIIDPRLQGVQLNLSPFVILVSLSLWGYIWGIAGMFLAVPITSVLQIICANVKSLRTVAVIISSGKSYRRQYEEEKALAKAKRKAQQQEKRDKRNGVSSESEASQDSSAGVEADSAETPKAGKRPVDRNVEAGMYDFIMPEYSRKEPKDAPKKDAKGVQSDVGKGIPASTDGVVRTSKTEAGEPDTSHKSDEPDKSDK